MDGSGATTFTKYEMMAIVAIVSVGLTAIVAVGGGGRIIPIIFILGFFISLPLIYVIGDRFPMVESPAESGEGEMTKVESLRDQYAFGEIDDEEFERRLDQLLEMDENEEASTSSEARGARPLAERE